MLFFIFINRNRIDNPHLTTNPFLSDKHIVETWNFCVINNFTS